MESYSSGSFSDKHTGDSHPMPIEESNWYTPNISILMKSWKHWRAQLLWKILVIHMQNATNNPSSRFEISFHFSWAVFRTYYIFAHMLSFVSIELRFYFEII